MIQHPVLILLSKLKLSPLQLPSLVGHCAPTQLTQACQIRSSCTSPPAVFPNISIERKWGKTADSSLGLVRSFFDAGFSVGVFESVLSFSGSNIPHLVS